MGRPSKFTPQQDEHIDSYMAAFEAKVLEVDPDLKSESHPELTAWKNATAEEIKRHHLFQDKLNCDGNVTMSTWTHVCFNTLFCITDPGLYVFFI